MSDNEITHPLFAAVYDTAMPEETMLEPHRRYLVRNLSGDVLDLGAGTGTMFSYFEDATDRSNATFCAIEPDPHMLKQAKKKAEPLDLDIKLEKARAESLPYEDDSFDTVIAGIVFCTIQDVGAALDEVARVLRPGGEFRFLEHVHDDGLQGKVQSAINPAWKRAIGGCQLTRDTVAAFAGHDAFDAVEIEEVGIGVPPLKPFVRGQLRRRSPAHFWE
ncbi:class I SAM-dependent methyltransferase [Natronococcus roseus]|uniref:class I SAM-dependent methyltransferase n=1 Tax=Natronococcus roseus TaxID=1052014 RepID=UPI00374CBA0F